MSRRTACTRRICRCTRILHFGFPFAIMVCLLLGVGTASADIVIIRTPPAAMARGLPLRVGDVLREGTDVARLDVYRLVELEAIDATRGTVALTRIRDGKSDPIAMPAGRWDVVAAPVDPDASAQIFSAAAMAAARREFDTAARDYANAARLGSQHDAVIAYAQAMAFENHPDRALALDVAAHAVARLRESNPTSPLLAAALLQLANASAQARDNPGALAAAVEAIALAPDTLIAANAEVLRAFVSLRTRNLDVAATSLDAAEGIVLRIAPDGLDHAALLSRRAVSSAIRREGDTATRLYADSLRRLQQLVPGSMLLGRVAYNAHLHALERRRYAEAEAQARTSMRAFRGAAANGLEFAQARAALAEVLMRRTEYAEAETLLRAASNASDAIDARSYEALSLRLQLADALARQRRYPDALALLDAIDAVHGAADAPAALADTSIDADAALYRADVLAQLDRCPEAISAARRAVDRYLALDRPGTTHWDAHLVLSDCKRRTGDTSAAVADAQLALDGFRGISADGIQTATAYFALARALRDRGFTPAAILAYRAAIAHLEAHRARVGGTEEVRARWAAQFQDFHKELMWLEAQGGDANAVLESETAYREQALLQLLDESDGDLAPHWTGRATVGEFREFDLPEDTALVSFVVGSQGTVAIVLRPGESEATVFALPVVRASLNADIQRLLLLSARSSAHPKAKAELARVSHVLWRSLIAPLMPSLGRYARWIIVADGPLLGLPWAALEVQGKASPRYLVEERVLSVVPSAPVWAALAQRRGTDSSIVAFADPETGGGPAVDTTMRGATSPRLPGARREAQQLSAAFPGRVTTYVGARATEAEVRRRAPAAGSIHFALHSVVDAREPMASHVVLARNPGQRKSTQGNARDDGRLRADEIARELELDAELVVLSSCASARGLDAGGEGLLGLVRALHLAGARAVIGTQWPVADAATVRLMRDFYRHRGAGLDSAAALAAAQRDWLHASRDASLRSRVERAIGIGDALPASATHPFHWAAFTHSGPASR